MSGIGYTPQTRTTYMYVYIYIEREIHIAIDNIYIYIERERQREIWIYRLGTSEPERLGNSLGVWVMIPVSDK